MAEGGQARQAGRECGRCGERIRPVADGDGIAAEDRGLYPWVSEHGSPVCGGATVHEPKSDGPGRDVWVVIAEDRHVDVDAVPFSTEGGAFAAAREVAAEYAKPHPELLREEDLTGRNRADGWVLCLAYGTEGDCVRVVKRRMDELTWT
jgi:hypothetical protein